MGFSRQEYWSGVPLLPLKGVIEDLKKKIKRMIIVKIYLGLSLVLLWTVWGQFIFRYFLDPAYTSQDL